MDKGKAKVDEYTSSSDRRKDKAVKEIWEDDAAAAALGGWFPGRRREWSLFLGILEPQAQGQFFSVGLPEEVAGAGLPAEGAVCRSCWKTAVQFFSADDPNSEVLTPDHQKVPTNAATDSDTNNLEVQTQLPTQPTKERTFLDLLLGEEDFELSPLVPEDNKSYSSPSFTEVPKMSLEETNETETADMKPPEQFSECENIVSGSSVGSGPQFSGAPAKVKQDSRITIASKHDVGFLPVQSSFSSSSRSAVKNSADQDSQITVLNKDAVGDQPVESSGSSSSSSRSAQRKFAEIMAIQEACIRALYDPDQDVPYRLLRQSIKALKNHYAPDIEVSYSARRPAPGHGRASGSSQIQNSSGRGVNNRNSQFHFLLQQIKYPLNNSMRLIHIKGHIPAFSADPIGSRFIQQKLGIASTGEIVMVYKEIIPHVCTLVIDVFANYVIQKLLEHGPPVYRRKLINNLHGQVFDVSLNLYGCRVIQKAFEISDLDGQIGMAKELRSSLLKCVRDQHGNHVVQKCIECVPAQYIQFVYRSLCGKVKMLSCHPYGCRVVQKVLELCDDPRILHAFVSEIVESVHELSADQFGNYVVQYIVEHGGARDRQIIVLKLAGRMVQMSHHKYSSNVIEKCLVHGSYHDRQMITTEILCAGGGDHHLLGMMVHQYANYVVQKMIDAADEWQFTAIVDVVRRHAGTLVKYAHGRHVITQVDRLLAARASVAPPQLALRR